MERGNDLRDLILDRNTGHMRRLRKRCLKKSSSAESCKEKPRSRNRPGFAFSGALPRVVPGQPRTGASNPVHPASWITAHLPPNWPQRAERRSMSLEASAPHPMSHGARAVGARCWQHSQINPQPWRDAPEVGEGGGSTVRLTPWRGSSWPIVAASMRRAAMAVAMISPVQVVPDVGTGHSMSLTVCRMHDER